jgi:hypothetical protein
MEEALRPHDYPGNKIEEYLRESPGRENLGHRAADLAFLQSHRIDTALQYAKQKEWVDAHMSKPYREIWEELRGNFVYPLTIGEKHDYQSISKTKTFTPPSNNREFVFSQLSKNVENACIKARRHSLAPKKIFFFLKTQEFRYAGIDLSLQARVSAPHEILRLVRNHFDKVYRPKVLYRATGVTLVDLAPDDALQLDLFGSVATLEKWQPVYAAIDMLDHKFGKHTVYLGSSFKAMNNRAHLSERGDIPARDKILLKGESHRRRINIPLIGEAK